MSSRRTIHWGQATKAMREDRAERTTAATLRFTWTQDGIHHFADDQNGRRVGAVSLIGDIFASRVVLPGAEIKRVAEFPKSGGVPALRRAQAAVEAFFA